jgi:hypothetical protein
VEGFLHRIQSCSKVSVPASSPVLLKGVDPLLFESKNGNRHKRGKKYKNK